MKIRLASLVLASSLALNSVASMAGSASESQKSVAEEVASSNEEKSSSEKVETIFKKHSGKIITLTAVTLAAAVTTLFSKYSGLPFTARRASIQTAWTYNEAGITQAQAAVTAAETESTRVKALPNNDPSKVQAVADADKAKNDLEAAKKSRDDEVAAKQVGFFRVQP